MKNFVLILILFLVSTSVFSQVKLFERCPRQYSFEAGYRYDYSNSFSDNSGSGYGMLFDWSWKMSGFVNKHNIYLSVPMGYTMMTANDLAHTEYSVLNYGWTVRHELLKNKKTLPFLGYALLLNQYRISGTSGSVFGHQTKFEFGYNFRCDKKVIYFAKIEYGFTRYARLGDKISNKVYAVELKVGLRW